MHSLRFIRRSNIFFVAGCMTVFLVSVSGLFFPVFWSDKEFRDLAPLPRFDRHEEIDAYVRDHFGMRESLVGLANLTSLLFFHEALDSRMVLGREGWLFYNEYSEIPYETPLSTEQLEIWRAYMEGRTRWFRRHKIPFYFFVTPDKQSIYPEYLAYSRKVPTRTQQLKEYLEKHSFVRILEPTDALLEGKKSGIRLYYKHGTHWNSMGAFVAYRFLAKHLPAFIPEPIGPERLEVHVDYFPEQSLLRMMHLRFLGMFDQSVENVLKGSRATIIDVSPPSFPATEWRLYSTGDSRLPRALVYNDSFFTLLMPYFSQHFDRVLYVNRGSMQMSAEDLQSMQPQLVIQQFVERKLKYASPPLDPWMKEENDRLKD